MDSRRRWTVLALAFAGTVAAIFYPFDDATSDAAYDAAPSLAVAQRAIPTPKSALPTPVMEARASWIAADANPFESKAWQPPQPVAATSRTVQPVIAAEAPPPPPPPPLPFKFIGQMNDGSDLIVYLSSGEQVVVARLGDLLDGGYKVSTISPTNIEFVSASSGLKQSLAIPAKEN
ncbi:hypothetical protein GTP45_12770 [Pseudoduganella sp. FT55W]|uniref:Secretion system X translation initiation factor n=1 Tax=Duganella rivi TaxID=2666083 RepID=A0A7X4KC80_9BURK|nr:hypothetical protein [Duganella rivi]MYM67702.1 hypothetical protein [Duganella rivi]